ncbi:peptidoglycan-binding protein [Neobacillus sp. MM2021_6]|uniref:peptidoglycan recognition protein family protein n=1 Tax=Bacillaceae TaxID=186817 RepID=UPI00140C2474|nr:MULTISPECIES: N-acetylmuramoyl-L-alanine amidase [Bacillaceae]MBO0962394.1 peptidoglycan-binding protein [Neobacillus sp. MM2021_6]NHC21037.1 N-acetylmuramoyl-L-alanine amidase [Bacillus sp. MM2020_4]
MNINQRFIPASNTKTRPGIKMAPTHITMHETDNNAKGANDEAHAGLQANGNSREASWHYQVDCDSIWQSLPDNEVGWHAGDGRGSGNMKSIAIEICVNSDGNFVQAVNNAAWLVQYLMNKHNIPITNIVQHNKWSGKNCPRHLRAGDWGVNWADFINLVKGVQPTPSTVDPIPVVNKPVPAATTTLLKKGSKGDAVKKYQQDLIKSGEQLPRYGADGDFGQETEDATKAFQARHKLSVDGIAGPNTLAKLAEVLKPKTTPVASAKPAPSTKDIVPYPGHLIKQGSRGKDTERIQRAVGVNPDAIYGPKTTAAVKAYQSRHGLAADGIVGPATWSMMF